MSQTAQEHFSPSCSQRWEREIHLEIHQAEILFEAAPLRAAEAGWDQHISQAVLQNFTFRKLLVYFSYRPLSIQDSGAAVSAEKDVQSLHIKTPQLNFTRFYS